MTKSKARPKPLAATINNIESDKTHHLTGPFLPQTPLAFDSRPTTPNGKHRYKPKDDFYESKGFWSDIITLRWMRVPETSFKLLITPVILYYIFNALNIQPNPFEPMLFISHRLPESSPDDPRYAKGYLDLAFLGYYIIFFSFVRQFAILKCFHPLARSFGIKRQSKVDRFGEQAYCVLYYGTMGAWGTYIMSKSNTWWYRTEFFWIDYPHWDLKPLLKRYYLMHFAYWIQQLAILGLRIEKPRSDFKELVMHHFVTIWLIGWSYLTNLTGIGNAVFVSMDVPDAFLAVSKLFNYLDMEVTKSISFAVFMVAWTYFRHWLNIVMLYSVWTEFDLIPESSKIWSPPDGVWLTWWMKYQIFLPLLLLKFLNIFWYILVWRIAIRTLRGNTLDDERSDDEGDADDDKED